MNIFSLKGILILRQTIFVEKHTDDVESPHNPICQAVSDTKRRQTEMNSEVRGINPVGLAAICENW